MKVPIKITNKKGVEFVIPWSGRQPTETSPSQLGLPMCPRDEGGALLDFYYYSPDYAKDKVDVVWNSYLQEHKNLFDISDRVVEIS